LVICKIGPNGGVIIDNIALNDFKPNRVYPPVARFKVTGGSENRWNILGNVSQKNMNAVGPSGGGVLGELEYVIEKSNRFNCPIVLDPKHSTFLDVAVWAHHNERMQISTIKSRIRYAKFMQNHKVPVDFSNPTYKNFRYHMDFREVIEEAGIHALINEWKTMRMFLNAFGITPWPYKPPLAPEHKKRNLPFPGTVREFFYYDYSKDPYERALYQYLFSHSFLIGWRVPSEPCEMTLNDVIIDSDGFGSVTITEPKKNRSERTIVPEKHILSSLSHKSLRNWIDKWRPRAENQYSGDALYLWPSGKPITKETLRCKLSEHGKKIWPHFRPYDVRHWCAISRLIETKIQTGIFDTFTVKNWLGHTKIKSTEEYIGHAEMYFKQFNKSWIHSALRSIFLRGKHHGPQNRVLTVKKTLHNFLLRILVNPARSVPPRLACKKLFQYIIISILINFFQF
jgi:integrase